MSHEEFAPFVCLVGCFVVIIFYYKPEQISSSFFSIFGLFLTYAQPVQELCIVLRKLKDFSY